MHCVVAVVQCLHNLAAVDASYTAPSLLDELLSVDIADFDTPVALSPAPLSSGAQPALLQLMHRTLAASCAIYCILHLCNIMPRLIAITFVAASGAGGDSGWAGKCMERPPTSQPAVPPVAISHSVSHPLCSMCCHVHRRQVPTVSSAVCTRGVAVK